MINPTPETAPSDDTVLLGTLNICPGTAMVASSVKDCMVVFGIDPGSTVTAYGIVRRHRGRLHYVDSGFIRTSSKTSMESRLLQIHTGLVEALGSHEIDEVSIEAIFSHKSSESALRLGQARGVALLAAAQKGFAPTSYNPMTIKRSIGAHGRADKAAVAKMVGMLLGVVPEGPNDLTDALAIAITHLNHCRQRAAGLVR